MRALLSLWLLLTAAVTAQSQVVYETLSKYNHIRVYDQRGIRILSFSGSQETKMSLANPLMGHFEYTEYFHMPWLWNDRIGSVLMIGLGGGSTQRSFLNYYPDVMIDTVELDPAVIKVAREYFRLPESDNLKVHAGDGRMFLRRSTSQYDVILLDAYTSNRYGSFIPFQLTTREFFELAKARLTENGVLAYNVIGTIHGWRADILGALYRTLDEVFPNVYLFPAEESQNVVLIATMSEERYPPARVRVETEKLMLQGRVRLPTFQRRVLQFEAAPPPNAARSPVLTDNRAPTDGLLGSPRK